MQLHRLHSGRGLLFGTLADLFYSDFKVLGGVRSIDKDTICNFTGKFEHLGTLGTHVDWYFSTLKASFAPANLTISPSMETFLPSMKSLMAWIASFVVARVFPMQCPWHRRLLCLRGRDQELPCRLKSQQWKQCLML